MLFYLLLLLIFSNSAVRKQFRLSARELGRDWLTRPVEGVAGAVIVVALVESQPDVSGALRGLQEHQARHIAPQLESGADSQSYCGKREEAGPVDDLVGQVTFVPLLN